MILFHINNSQDQDHIVTVDILTLLQCQIIVWVHIVLIPCIQLQLVKNIIAAISINTLQAAHTKLLQLLDTIILPIIIITLNLNSNSFISTMHTATTTCLSLTIIGTGILTTIIITVHKEDKDWLKLKVTLKRQQVLILQHNRTPQLKEIVIETLLILFRLSLR